ncbi:hypothetical protein OIE66_37755 [Nonomuraea sp. NBC_01738]|uniref:hypothetical protein n=1 Tax=Nonomuraea sp. NBC_01738 TaxID=2976003 RepID=UPI002E12B64E|nr:hypothetical protein OIE66_37755 [Nonomuraea sp. NBC_01738]
MVTALTVAASLVLTTTPTASAAAPWATESIPITSLSPTIRGNQTLAPAAIQRPQAPADSLRKKALKPVRYVGLTTCATPKRHICGPWHLWLVGGKVITLPDAQVRSIDPQGREEAQRAPISVDATGRYAAYVSTKSKILTVRSLATGKTTPIPGALPKDLAMSDVDLLISPLGRYVVIDPTPGTRATTVIEVATGKHWSLPDYARVQGFSPHGSMLRVILDFEETAVYEPGGPKPSGGTTVTGWGALASGGKTLAGAAREGKRVFIRFYATSNAMESRNPIKLSIPAKNDPRRLYWTSATTLSLLTLRQPGTYVTRSINTKTGKARIVDRFTISPHTWDVHLAGE